VHDALAAIRVLCRAIVPINVETHAAAVRLAERHGYSIFGASMIAAALRADCSVFLSEDMQDGILINGRLRIVNPFRAG
jgi:predicted nucleic acid-binding protein